MLLIKQIGKKLDEYKHVFAKLNTLDLIETKMTLHLKLILAEEDKFFEEDWVDPYFIDGSMCKYAPDKEETFCLGFNPWAELIGVEIDEETERDYSPEEIISYCLYDMAFYEFAERRIKGQLDELDRGMKEAEEHSEKLIPLDEVMDRIKKKLKKGKTNEYIHIRR